MVTHEDREKVRVSRGRIVTLAKAKIILARLTSYASLGQFFMVYLLLAIPYIRGTFLTVIGAVILAIIMILVGWWDFNRLYGVENELAAIQSPIAVKYYHLFDRLEQNQKKILERLDTLEKK